MTDLTKLSTDALHKLTRKLLQDRPIKPEDWAAHVAQLRALSNEIQARAEQKL